jgi:opine dehydrogenase
MDESVSKNSDLKICVVGGGSSAHVLISLLGGSFADVSLLTQRPECWAEHVQTKYIGPGDSVLRLFSGRICVASSHPQDVITHADVIIFCLPVHVYRVVLHRIAPFISREKEVFLGAIYGQGGINWMVGEIEQRFNLSNLTCFAFGLIPWICRTEKYGEMGITYGPKKVNTVAVRPKERFSAFNDLFLRHICEDVFKTGAFQLAETFLSLTLSVDNQVIHPSRCFGLYLQSGGGGWHSEEEVPFFYRDYDQGSADLLRDLDDDYSAVRNAIRECYPSINFTYMLDYLALEHLTYGSSNANILESFTNSKTLWAIKTPICQQVDGKWELDRHNRFFTDDIDYGLCVAKWIADSLGVNVPTIDRIVDWAREFCGKQVSDAGRLAEQTEGEDGLFRTGVPSVYGFESVADLINAEEI